MLLGGKCGVNSPMTPEDCASYLHPWPDEILGCSSFSLIMDNAPPKWPWVCKISIVVELPGSMFTTVPWRKSLQKCKTILPYVHPFSPTTLEYRLVHSGPSCLGLHYLIASSLLDTLCLVSITSSCQVSSKVARGSGRVLSSNARACTTTLGQLLDWALPTVALSLEWVVVYALQFALTFITIPVFFGPSGVHGASELCDRAGDNMDSRLALVGSILFYLTILPVIHLGLRGR